MKNRIFAISDESIIIDRIFSHEYDEFMHFCKTQNIDVKSIMQFRTLDQIGNYSRITLAPMSQEKLVLLKLRWQ